MSLNWDASEIHDWETLHADEDQLAITHGIVWMLMATDIDAITEQNVEDAYFRATLQTRLLGYGTVRSHGEPYEFTLADYRRRIGLSTNVSYKTEKQWINGFLPRAKKEVLQSARMKTHNEEAAA